MLLNLRTNGIGKEQTTIKWTSNPLVNKQRYMNYNNLNKFAIHPYSL